MVIWPRASGVCQKHPSHQINSHRRPPPLMRGKPKPPTSSGDAPRPIYPSTSAPIPKSKPPRWRRMIQSVRSPLNRGSPQSFIKDNAACDVTFLEAVNSAADAFPPLKSVSGGALWIAKTLQVSPFSSEWNDLKTLSLPL